MTKILRGRIVGFVEGDDYKIIANIGAEQEVKVGMPFIVYYEGDEVIDPDTKEGLGKLEYVKANVKVSQVAEKYCILESDEYNVEGLSFLEKVVIPQSMPRRVKKPLHLARSERRVSIEDKGGIIKIGDLVRYDPSRG